MEDIESLKVFLKQITILENQYIQMNNKQFQSEYKDSSVLKKEIKELYSTHNIDFDDKIPLGAFLTKTKQQVSFTIRRKIVNKEFNKNIDDYSIKSPRGAPFYSREEVNLMSRYAQGLLDRASKMQYDKAHELKSTAFKIQDIVRNILCFKKQISFEDKQFLDTINFS
jgi:hypothetical protein